MKWIPRLAFVSALGLLATTQAGVYTCTDVSERKVYSDRPCLGTESEEIQIPVTPPGDGGASQGNGLRPGEQAMLEERKARERRRAEDARKLNLEQAARKRAAQAEQRRRQPACQRYRDRLEIARDRRRQGYTRREGEQIERDIRSLEANIDRYCG